MCNFTREMNCLLFTQVLGLRTQCRGQSINTTQAVSSVWVAALDGKRDRARPQQWVTAPPPASAALHTAALHTDKYHCIQLGRLAASCIYCGHWLSQTTIFWLSKGFLSITLLKRLDGSTGKKLIRQFLRNPISESPHCPRCTRQFRKSFAVDSIECFVCINFFIHN